MLWRVRYMNKYLEVHMHDDDNFVFKVKVNMLMLGLIFIVSRNISLLMIDLSLYG